MKVEPLDMDSFLSQDWQIKKCFSPIFYNNQSGNSHHRSRSVKEKTFVEDESMPRQEILEVVQEEIPKISKIPDTSRQEKSPIIKVSQLIQ